MRITVVLVALGILLVGSRADSAGPVMPEAGGVVVGSPTAPSQIVRLPAKYRNVDVGVGAAPSQQDRVFWAAKGVLADQFRPVGWAPHDPNNAVASFVADTREGRALFTQAVDSLGAQGTPSPEDPVIRKIAYSAGRRGLVQVVTEPEEVSVLLGEDDKGVTQVEFWCAAGRHQLTLQKTGYKSQTVTITVQPQQLTPVKATMARP